MNWNFEKSVVVIALMWYVATAIFSVGYYQADEHYQIIEFAQFKIGRNDVGQMAWEFKEQIRPALQPTIAYLVFKCCRFLSMNDPYIQALILRILTAFLSVFVINHFSKSCKPFVSPKLWRWFFVFSYFLWFLPFINVRFSSETWSGLLFLLALSVTIRKPQKVFAFIILGSLLGLSFLFRYQIAFAALGLVLWLLFVLKPGFKALLYVLISVVFVVGIGSVLDAWFYGDWTVVPYNYFYTNVILEKASDFGVSPWYGYLKNALYAPGIPTGILLLISIVILLFKKRSLLFLWVLVPFVLFHSIIPHKELRFMFPLVNLIPILIFTGLSCVSQFDLKKVKLIIGVSVGVLVLVNSIGIVVASFKPAGIGRVAMTKQIADLVKEKDNQGKIELYHTSGANPYDQFDWLPSRFYENVMVSTIKMDSFENIEIKPKTNQLIVLKKKDVDLMLSEFAEEDKVFKVGQSIPIWCEPILQVYGFDVGEVLILYQIS